MELCKTKYSITTVTRGENEKNHQRNRFKFPTRYTEVEVRESSIPFAFIIVDLLR
jgi:hypothetical protein